MCVCMCVFARVHVCLHALVHVSTFASSIPSDKFVPANIVQWNPSNPDTLGPESTVLIIEVSSFQGLEMYCGLL